MVRARFKVRVWVRITVAVRVSAAAVRVS